MNSHGLNLEAVCSNAALVAYALASLLYLRAFGKGDRAQLTARAGFALFAIATAAATAALAFVAKEATLLDMSGVLLAAALGWIAIAGHLKFDMRLIGGFVAPLCTLILLIKFFVAPPHASPSGFEASPWLSTLLRVHVVLAIVGQAFAILASAVALAYLWQQGLLKKKLLDQLPRNFPAIDRLERALTIALWSGFTFLTLGLISGAIYTQQAGTGGASGALAVKVVWAILVWLWYLAILIGRGAFAWSAPRIARLSFAGFLLLAVSYFGMGFFRV